MALADLNSVIGQIVVDSVGLITTAGEESEHSAVVVQELLLGHHFAAAERLLHVAKQIIVLLQGNGLLAHLEGVAGGSLRRRQGTSL